jgi:hypothetical protein
MTLDVERDPVRVNKLLGERASIGPIPAEQLLPWVAIGGVSFFLFKMLLAVSFMTWLLIWFWLNTTWWLLTGRAKTYRFDATLTLIKNWAQPPGWDWTNGETLFFRAHDPCFAVAGPVCMRPCKIVGPNGSASWASIVSRFRGRPR